MDTNSIFFIIMSLFVITYLIQTFRTKKRVPIVLELFFIVIYAFVFVIVLFPKTLDALEILFGINNALNFIIYTSVFVAYFMIFVLYQKDEKQRIEISKLNREISYLKKDIEDNNKIKSSNKVNSTNKDKSTKKTKSIKNEK